MNFDFFNRNSFADVKINRDSFSFDTLYGNSRSKDEETRIPIGIESTRYGTRYGGVIPDVIDDKPIFGNIGDYTGSLDIKKGSSLEEANSHINIEDYTIPGAYDGTYVSSNENLSNIEKSYLEGQKYILAREMSNFTGKVDTKNLDEVSALLSDAAQSGLSGNDAKTFKNLGNELQKVVDNAKTFKNYSFQEGYKPDLNGKLNSEKTIEYLKSDNGKAVLEELGINLSNLDSSEIDSHGNIVIDGKTIQLSDNKLSISEQVSKERNIMLPIGPGINGVRFSSVEDKTYNTSTYELDDKYKPNAQQIEKPVEPEKPNAPEKPNEEQHQIDSGVYQKYHVDGAWTNLHEKDPETGKNLHMPDGMEISTMEMKWRVNDNEFVNKLTQATGKDISELKCFANHAYYLDEQGIEHQFYYDETNDKFINSNVKSNSELGGYDVEVNIV